MAEGDFREGFIHFCGSAVYFVFDVVSLDVSSNCRHFGGSQLLRLVGAASSFPCVFGLRCPGVGALYGGSGPKVGNVCPVGGGGVLPCAIWVQSGGQIVWGSRAIFAGASRGRVTGGVNVFANVFASAETWLNTFVFVVFYDL